MRNGKENITHRIVNRPFFITSNQSTLFHLLSLPSTTCFRVPFHSIGWFIDDLCVTTEISSFKTSKYIFFWNCPGKICNNIPSKIFYGAKFSGILIILLFVTLYSLRISHPDWCLLYWNEWKIRELLVVIYADKKKGLDPEIYFYYFIFSNQGNMALTPPT